MKIQRICFLLLLYLASAFIEIHAETYRPRPRTRIDNLLGDMNGIRTYLGDRGITLSGFHAMTLQENISGGLSRGFGYTGILNAGLEFDLEKILGLEDASFYVSGSWATGSNLSSNRIGNIFVVSTVFSGQSLRLYELWFRQKLQHDKIDVKIGRLSPANDFGNLPVLANYVSGALNDLPGTLLLNDSNFTADPVAQWGIRAAMNVTDHVTLRSGVYNADPNNLGENVKHGTDFAFRPGRGVISVGEIEYDWHQKALEKYPGLIKVGGFYDSNRQPTFRDPSHKEPGNSLVYVASQQMIYQPNGAGTDQGLTVWWDYSYGPNREVGLVTYFAGAGLSYKGLIPSRENDALAFGVAKGWITPDEEHLTYETIFDLSYVYAINKSWTFQPDIQYVMRPGGSGTIPGAWVVGFMMMMQF